MVKASLIMNVCFSFRDAQFTHGEAERKFEDISRYQIKEYRRCYKKSSFNTLNKCEIFDSSDYHDFYTIKPLWGDDFGAKI